MVPWSKRAAETRLAYAGVLFLVFTVVMLQVAQAKPRKPKVVDCMSGGWSGWSTPEMRACEDKVAFDHQTRPNDPQTWHYLQCFSDGTAQCCEGSGVCTKVSGRTKLPPAGILEGDTVLSPQGPTPTGGSRGTPSRGGGRLY